MNFWSEFKSCFKIWMSNWIFCLISHNGMFIQSFLSVWISGGFVWIFDLYRFHHGYEFKSCPFKVLLSFVNLLSRISQWNFVCCFIQSCEFLNSRIKSCPESLVAFLIMEPSVLFHSKLWMLNWWTNWIFCLISHNGIFIKSYCQHGFLVDLFWSVWISLWIWIQVLSF